MFVELSYSAQISPCFALLQEKALSQAPLIYELYALTHTQRKLCFKNIRVTCQMKIWLSDTTGVLFLKSNLTFAENTVVRLQ